MKTKLFIILISFLGINSFSQIKVLTNGAINLGKTITGVEYLKIDYTGYYGGGLAVYPSLTNSTAYLGTSSNRWMYIYSQYVLQVSDSRFKENLKSIDNALVLIQNLKGVKYDFKLNTYISDTNKISGNLIRSLEKDRKNQIGFLAQDVQKVLPEVVFYDDSTDIYSIDYVKIIPVLVEAIKEQQIQIESLKKAMPKFSVKSQKIETGLTEGDASVKAELEQNFPNPFNQSTEIGYYIPESASSAVVYIYNMNGLQIRSFPIKSKGSGSIIINASELQAGMYMYTLVVDGKEIETKRMLLTE